MAEPFPLPRTDATGNPMFDGSRETTRAFIRQQYEALSVAAFGVTCQECGKKFACKCPACSQGKVVRVD